MRHFLTLKDISSKEMMTIIDNGIDIKKSPEKYAEAMTRKTLLMIFEKPSLRTRLSFETGMTQMGGHAIFYSTANSPLGKKESPADTMKVASRMVDIIMARLFSHEMLEEMAKNATIPVINALTNFSHPCQILADLMTVKEKFGKLSGLKLAYLGDSNNNVTHSLMFGCSMAGMDIAVGCPKGEDFEPDKKVTQYVKDTASKNSCSVLITNDAEEAVKNANVIYTDSWMSYHIAPEKEKERVETFKPYQVNQELMKLADKNAVFMNCLPAMRGYEQTAEVIDGPQSIVFQEAENRLHAQKALMLFLLNQ